MIRQIFAVSELSLRSLPARLGNGWVIIIGIAVAVAVMISVEALAVGFGKTLAGSAGLDRAIVIRSGAKTELTSVLSRQTAVVVENTLGVKKDPQGRAIATAEAVMMIALPLKSTGSNGNVTLRGIEPGAAAIRKEQRLVSGRMFQPALHELIVGRAAVGQFKNLGVGDHVVIRNADWTIVGSFESGGDAHESELQGDVQSVVSLFQRNFFQSVTVLLESPAAFDGFKSALLSDPRLNVDVRRESEYYAEQSTQLSRMIRVIGYVVGGVMALGATFSAFNSMYAALAVRRVEIATLRAIGFGGLAVAFSFVLESLLLALVGSVLGSAVSWLLFNGNTASTLGANTSELVFHLTITPALIVSAIIVAICIGITGSVFPAISAARTPVAAALRSH